MAAIDECLVPESIFLIENVYMAISGSLTEPKSRWMARTSI